MDALVQPTVFGLILLLAGCGSTQIYSTSQHQALGLESSQLRTYGVALFTPSTVTTQEEDRQALALVFSDVIGEVRADIPFVSLSQMLSAVNAAGLTDDYKHMFDEYRNTGIFKRETLRRIAEVAGARYVVQLKLASFEQGSLGRWSIVGIRVVQTKWGSGRLFLQIWDSVEGTIVWEGVEEVSYANDTTTERSVTFRAVVEEAARNLVGGLP